MSTREASASASGSRQAPRRWRRWRRRAWLILAILGLLLALDWSRAPSSQVTTRLELAAIGRYQTWISPWLKRGGVRCRFTPSCSHFAAAVVARDGFVRGNLRTVGRVVRCGPWTGAGTVDPP